jgi:hypothetical protein
VREHAVSYGAAVSLGPDRVELVRRPGRLIDSFGVAVVFEHMLEHGRALGLD